MQRAAAMSEPSHGAAFRGRQEPRAAAVKLRTARAGILVPLFSRRPGASGPLRGGFAALACWVQRAGPSARRQSSEAGREAAFHAPAVLEPIVRQAEENLA